MSESTVLAAESAHIDPIDCDSTVSYRILRNSHEDSKTGETRFRISATVQLADCSRKIDWYFGGDHKQQLAKIDKALSMLRQFRKELNSALSSVAKKKAE